MVVKTHTFDFEGQTYEVRAVLIDGRYRVAAFIGNRRANCYEYTADSFTDFQMTQTHQMHAYEHLMSIAESDVREKMGTFVT